MRGGARVSYMLSFRVGGSSWWAGCRGGQWPPRLTWTVVFQRAKFLMKKMVCVALVLMSLLVVFTPAVLVAQSVPEPKCEAASYECFNLWTSCALVYTGPPLVTDDVHELGLTYQSVWHAAESHLRSARIFEEDVQNADVQLDLQVAILGGAFVVRANLAKWLYDPLSSDIRRAYTWESLSFGTHSGRPEYLRSVLEDALDEFIVDYLRVNAPACGGPGGGR